MIAIIGLFIILILALTVIRIGAIALELTGLSTDVADFQAQWRFQVLALQHRSRSRSSIIPSEGK